MHKGILTAMTELPEWHPMKNENPRKIEYDDEPKKGQIFLVGVDGIKGHHSMWTSEVKHFDKHFYGDNSHRITTRNTVYKLEEKQWNSPSQSQSESN